MSTLFNAAGDDIGAGVPVGAEPVTTGDDEISSMISPLSLSS